MPNWSRIPPSPQTTKQKGIEKSIPFVFFPATSLLVGGGEENKWYSLLLFAQWSARAPAASRKERR